MDFLNKVIEAACSILVKNEKCSINIETIDNKLTVRILKGRRLKTYCDKDSNIVIMKMKEHFIV